MTACEKCWAESGGDAGEYYALLAARKASPCTPEEQAGPQATRCLRCNRMTRHQHTSKCMACGRRADEPGHVVAEPTEVAL